MRKDADQRLCVEFPDLPGCFSAADDLDDLYVNAVEAVQLYLEDADTVPAPTPMAQFMEASPGPGGGRIPAGGAYIRSTGRPVRANISLDSGMLDAIDQVAKLRRLTLSAFIAELARNEIEGKRNPAG